MKTTKKLLALALAMGMLTVSAGCADQSWSYKDDMNTLSIGTYIYYMSGAYGYASNQVSSAQTESATQSGTEAATEAVDVLTQEIENPDGDKVNAQDYILQEAENACKNLLNTEKLFAQKGLTLSETELTAAESNADQAWSYYRQTYESLGVSKDSFYRAEYLFAAKYNALFEAIYGIGGEKAVSDDEIKAYFTENYTNYAYLPMNLYTTADSESDDASSTTSTAVAFSEEEVQQATEEFNAYAQQINDGSKTYDEIAQAYTTDAGLEENPSVTNTEILEDSSLGDELKEALEGLDANQATVIQVGEDSTAVLYLVYKGDIHEEAENVFEESQRSSVLYSMKFEEYQEDMDAQAKAYECEKNDAAINRYQPSMFKDVL